MSWKEIYRTNQNRKIQEIAEIQGDFAITSSVNHLLKNHPYRIVIIVSIIILLFLFTFYQNPKALFSAVLLFGFILFAAIFFQSFSIVGKKKKITVKADGQEIIIPYDKLKQLYIEETYFHLFFKKYYQYFLVLLYESSNHHICDIKLSTTLLQEKEVEDLWKKVKLKPCQVNYQRQCSNHKKRRFFKKAILFVLLSLIIFILSLFA